jgi:hypothetical protein
MEPNPTSQPITLIFSPTFGIEHFDKATGEVSYVVDNNLAGVAKVFTPLYTEDVKRLGFTIGRAPDCFIQIGKLTPSGVLVDNRYVNSVVDSIGISYFDQISRAQVTIFLDKKPDDDIWIWSILLGGVFIDPITKERVSITRTLLPVYLNGVILRPNNKEPLFVENQDFTFLSLGLTARILIRVGALSEHSTALPKSIWETDLWPTQQMFESDRIEYNSNKNLSDRVVIENDILKSQPESSENIDSLQFNRINLTRTLIREFNSIPLIRLIIYSIVALLAFVLYLILA